MTFNTFYYGREETRTRRVTVDSPVETVENYFQTLDERLRVLQTDQHLSKETLYIYIYYIA